MSLSISLLFFASLVPRPSHQPPPPLALATAPCRLAQPPRLCATTAAAASSSSSAAVAWASSLGDDVHGAEAGAAFYDLFRGLASSAEFARQTFARRPLLIESAPGIPGSFTLEHLREAVDGDFLDAGRGVPDLAAPGGWKMAAVSQPRGPSFEDAKMRYVDVEEAMRLGTVVFNSAGAHIPRLGTMCLAALDAFGMPNCLNLYVTAKGTATSAPPHTDKQDVFVLQSQGAKRWRVYEPPPPAKKPHADPLARGKAHDGLELSELAEPLLDVVLAPGQVLYVPAGFPHTTDTENTASAGAAASDASVHLTIGLDTHIWGLNYASLRSGALDRAKLPDKLNVLTLGKERYWELMGVPPSVGFLRRHVGGAAGGEAGGEAGDEAGGEAGGEAAAAAVVEELVATVRAAEASRWEGSSAEEVAATLQAAEVAAQCERHAERVVGVQRAMYLDAARDVRPSAPGMPRVSIFRVKEHMAKLETAMEEHLQWYGPAAVARAVAAATGAPPHAAKSNAKVSAKAKDGGGGGMGNGIRGGGAKKAKPKKKKKK